MRPRPPILRPLLTLAASALAAAAAHAAESPIEGRWVGAILFEEGRIELDMVARIDRGDDGGWSAAIDMPLVGVENRPVDSIEVAGAAVTLRFDLGDDGDERVLEGRLDSEGDTLTGTFTQGSRSSPVYLERRAAPSGPAPAVEVTELPPGLEGLREQFERDRGRVRLLLLLSPS